MLNKSIKPVRHGVSGEVDIPGSKYIANRAVMIASLADRESLLSGVPSNDDINTAIEQWGKLGATIERDKHDVRIKGVAGRLQMPVDKRIFSSASGTFSRFICATLAIADKAYTLSGDAKMNTRPMGDLFSALRVLGANVVSDNDRLPAQITGPLKGGEVAIPGNISSQYISALLIAGPYMQEALSLSVVGELVSEKYIAMTVGLMQAFNASISVRDRLYIVDNKQQYLGHNLMIEADPVSSSYFMAIAALTGGSITINRFNRNSAQGEAQFPELLAQMGCRVEYGQDTLTVTGPKEKLNGIEADLSTMPDIGQTLAILGACAEGKTHLTNISHLKYKESDRIADTAKELRKVGIDVTFDDNNMLIQGGPITGARIETYDDHRMAMSFALLGLKVENLVIQHADVVNKSFPLYWDRIAALGLDVSAEQT